MLDTIKEFWHKHEDDIIVAGILLAVMIAGNAHGELKAYRTVMKICK